MLILFVNIHNMTSIEQHQELSACVIPSIEVKMDIRLHLPLELIILITYLQRNYLFGGIGGKDICKLVMTLMEGQKLCPKIASRDLCMFSRMMAPLVQKTSSILLSTSVGKHC